LVYSVHKRSHKPVSMTWQHSTSRYILNTN